MATLLSKLQICDVSDASHTAGGMQFLIGLGSNIMERDLKAMYIYICMR